jgi:hypothetical protein
LLSLDQSRLSGRFLDHFPVAENALAAAQARAADRPIEPYFGNSNFLFNRFTEAGGKAYRLQFEAYRL